MTFFSLKTYKTLFRNHDRGFKGPIAPSTILFPPQKIIFLLKGFDLFPHLLHMSFLPIPIILGVNFRPLFLLIKSLMLILWWFDEIIKEMIFGEIWEFRDMMMSKTRCLFKPILMSLLFRSIFLTHEVLKYKLKYFQ